MAITERVTQIIAEQFNIDENDITPETSFVNDIGADSFELIELIVTFEEEFDIEIFDNELEKMETVQKAIDCIEKHII